MDKATLEANAAEVLGRAAALCGDPAKARLWFHEQHLPEFGNQTPAALVAAGRRNDVLWYIEMLDAGPLG